MIRWMVIYKGVTHQGLSDDSMWARGQAWAIYGYTMVYRETHDVRFLDLPGRYRMSICPVFPKT